MQKLNKWLLFINLFFLQIYLIRFQIGPYPTNLQEILIALNGLTLLISQPESLKNLFKHKTINLFLGLTAITLIFSASGLIEILNNLELIRVLKFTLFASALTFIFLETLKTEKAKDQGLLAFSLGAAAFGLFSIIINLLGFSNTHDYRLIGVMDSAVQLAFYLTPALIFASIKITQTKEARPKKLYIILALFLAATIAATRSMGSIIGLFGALTIYLLKGSKKSIRLILVSIGIIIAAVTFWTKILPAVQTNYSSLNERGEIWLVATTLIKENPILGLGLGQFESHFALNAEEILNKPPLDIQPLHPHNIFLLFLINYGALGLAFLLYLAFQLTKNPLQIFNIILLYFFIHGLIDSPFLKNDILILFLLAASQTIQPNRAPTP